MVLGFRWTNAANSLRSMFPYWHMRDRKAESYHSDVSDVDKSHRRFHWYLAL